MRPPPPSGVPGRGRCGPEGICACLRPRPATATTGSSVRRRLFSLSDRGNSDMIAIETTPDAVTELYATMRQKLAIVRGRLQKPLTLADKVLLGHLDAPEAQELEP